MGKTYAQKISENAKLLAKGCIGVCEHPECSQHVGYDVAYIWSDRRCSTCLSYRGEPSKFLPTPKLIAQMADAILKKKKDRWGFGDMYTVCENPECQEEAPTSGEDRICRTCGVGRVVYTTRGLAANNYMPPWSNGIYFDRKPGDLGSKAAEAATPKASQPPVTWPDGPHVARIRERLAQFPKNVLAVCLCDLATHQNCANYARIPSNVGTPCLVNKDSNRINVPIAAALDRGIPLDVAIHTWHVFDGDENQERKYEEWVMAQPTKATCFDLVARKLASAPEGATGVCLNMGDPKKSECSCYSVTASGVGERCNKCGDDLGYMVNLDIAAAVGKGIELTEATRKWRELRHAPGVWSMDSVVANFEMWVEAKLLPESCTAVLLRKQEYKKFSYKKFVCVVPPGRTGNKDCPAWGDRANSTIGVACHLCGGILADRALAEAFDKLAPLKVEISTICDSRRAKTEKEFKQWTETMIQSGAATSAAPSTKPEETDMAATNTTSEEGKIEKTYRKVVATAKKDAGAAGWRLAATQITELSKPLLVAALCKDIPDANDSYRVALAKFFETPIGDAVFRGIIGISLPLVPSLDGSVIDNLAEEFRVSALEKGGNVIASHIIGPLTSVLSLAIRESTALKALKTAELPEGAPLTGRVDFSESDVVTPNKK